MADSPLLPVYRRASLRFVQGKGAWLTDDAGRHYLDFAAGIGVNAFGYGHEALTTALAAQSTKPWHLSNLYEAPEQERLARLLVEASFAERVFFCNSGAEAVEGSIKLMRKYHAAAGAPERVEIVTFAGAFHGRTLGALAAGGQKDKLNGFGPPAPGFRQLPCFDMGSVEQAADGRCAGFLLEPVQGEGGVRPVPPEFLRQLRAFCDAHGVLLALDEVQSGLGRTGRLFAHEWAGIAPDIMALAKSLGGGLPLGAVLASARAAEGMQPGSHGSTFGGSPLALAVGAKALELMLAEGFLDEVRRKAGLLKQGLAALLETQSELFDGLRGEGLMLGLICKIPAADFQRRLQAAGLLCLTASGNVLRLLPPLIVSETDIAAALRILRETAAKFAASA